MSVFLLLFGGVYAAVQTLLTWLLLLMEHYWTLWDVQCY